jgi:hypothetical protein
MKKSGQLISDLPSSFSTFAEFPMNTEMDFDALGRYVHAAEKVEELVMKRHNLAAEISRDLNKAATGHGGCVQEFDHSKVQAKVSQLAALNANLETSIAEANTYAGAAKRERIARS